MSLSNKRVAVVIPAKGTSKRVPGKNLAMLGGYHLIEWTIIDAMNSELVDDIYVSTDCEKITAISEGYEKVKVIERPSQLCLPDSSSESAIQHVLDNIKKKPDIICMMQCTSPFRYPGQIDRGIKVVAETSYDSLFFGYPLGRWIWNSDKVTAINYDPNRRIMTQQKKWELIECGDYIFTRDIFEKTGNRLGGAKVVTTVGKIASFDIDDEMDLQICRALVSHFKLDART